MKYIIANWKANKNYEEVKQWIDSFLSYNLEPYSHKVKVIICPPFPFIPYLSEKIKSSPFIKIGSQDLSQFDGGTYTGEVVGKSLFGLISYAIIGHSERRQFIYETEEIIQKKIDQALQNNISPILCVRDANDKVYDLVDFIVAEPPNSISTGDGFGVSLGLEDVLKMKDTLGITTQKLIYGGSVNEKNATTYLRSDAIDGVLPGGASLDPKRFYSIITAVD